MKPVEIYQEVFGKIDEKLGFNLTSYAVKGGFVVKKFYSRNDFHCVLEDKVFIDGEGNIFRDGKKIKPTSKKS